MPDFVIVDTSVLIILDKIGQLDLLQKVYKDIHTPKEVSQEFHKPLPDWIKIEKTPDEKYLSLIRTIVDIGEATAIALAADKSDPLLIMDDLKARKLAKRLQIKYTGTLGVINKAKEMGIIYKVRPLVDNLRKTDFRISDNVLENLLKRNGE
jgi:predicted nucleic acid-binding protein